MFQSSRNPSQGEMGIYIQVIVCLSYRSSVTATGPLIRGTKISSRRPALYAKPTIERLHLLTEATGTNKRLMREERGKRKCFV